MYLPRLKWWSILSQAFPFFLSGSVVVNGQIRFKLNGPVRLELSGCHSPLTQLCDLKWIVSWLVLKGSVRNLELEMIQYGSERDHWITFEEEALNRWPLKRVKHWAINLCGTQQTSMNFQISRWQTSGENWPLLLPPSLPIISPAREPSVLV